METKRIKKVIKYNESEEDDDEEEEEIKDKKIKNNNKKNKNNRKESESEESSENEESSEEEEEEESENENDSEEEFDDENESKSKKRKNPSKNQTKTNGKNKINEKNKKTTKTSQKKSKNNKNSDDDNDDDDDSDEDNSPKKKRVRKSNTSTNNGSKSTKTTTKTVKTTKTKPAPKRKSKVQSDEDNEDDENNDNGSDNDDEDDNDDENGSDSSNDDDDDDENDDNDNEDGEENNNRSKRTRSKKKSSSKSSRSSSPTKTKKIRKTSDRISMKSLTRLERLDEARKAYKWWEAEDLPHGVNWRKLEHPGIVFPPAYVRHNIPFLYDGKPVNLTAEQEEIVTFYAAIPEDGPQLGNPKTRPVFQHNFFEDFKATLTPGHVIKKFDKCDFSQIREHLNLQKSLKKAATDEEKLITKKEKESLVLRYGYALIDGRIEKMGNYNMEPPGLFRGRGEHPRTGAIKQRCFPESVDLNLSIDSCVPRCHLPGHAWQSIRHDPLVTWLCGWNENVQQSHKYVMLAASSSFKGKSDLEKYDKAIRLATQISKIRKDYTSKIKSKDETSKQLGTAMWVIDVLALRVGGEKGEDEADTVGCCSLRVEHVTFMESKNSSEPSYEIELEFLGKDSMLYKQTINFSTYGDLGKLVYRNIKSFCSGKESTDEIFEKLTPPILNRHLNSLMKGLTAKVFRTFNASITLEKELPTAEQLEGLTIQEKMIRYNAANREVAILCNHQKTVSKAAEVMFENLNEKLETLRQQRTELLSWRELIKKGKESKIPLKEDDTEVIDGIVEQLRAAQVLRDTAKTNDEKLEAASAMEAAKLAQKNDQKRRFQEKHMYKTIPSENSLEGKITRWQEDIRKLETDIRNRDENKEVALGTSKINYMDPRISVAWCKRCEVPIDKVFAKTLRDKFNWAMAVPPDWKFTPETK